MAGAPATRMNGAAKPCAFGAGTAIDATNALTTDDFPYVSATATVYICLDLRVLRVGSARNCPLATVFLGAELRRNETRSLHPCHRQRRWQDVNRRRARRFLTSRIHPGKMASKVKNRP